MAHFSGTLGILNLRFSNRTQYNSWSGDFDKYSLFTFLLFRISIAIYFLYDPIYI